MTADRGRRGPRRGVVVVVALLAALAVLGVTTRPWVVADLTGPLAGRREVVVAGAQASPLVSAVGLVALAAAAALSIAGRVGSRVVAVLLVLAGAGAAAGALAVLSDPGSAAAQAVSEATGGTGTGGGAVTATAWPWLTLPVAAGLAGAGAVALVGGGRWSGARRFEAPVPGTRPRRPDPATDWDALSRGGDPTADGPEEPSR